MPYNHKTIEKKWQERWAKEGAFVAADKVKPNKKKYILDMFPYPSGAGLHVGHPEGYTATDIYSRYLRMKGYQVLHPMGWDAFGLPAENYAIKSGVHPKESTDNNIKTFTRQIKSLGFSYDWTREVNTSSPDYYKWTQWLFLQLYKHGLAYKKAAPVNWCADCQTVLANEQVVAGACERCHNKVVQKNLEQWFFKITGSGKHGSYPERLLSNLEKLDWPEPIKTMQRNWIGRSEGVEIEFRVQSSEFRDKVDFVLLHGFNGDSQGVFFPWLKGEIEKRGFKVVAPDLPNPEQPTEEEQVGYVLKNIQFDENTILFGHSLGAAVALKVAEKLKTKIRGLVLAGGFSSPKFKDKSRPFHNTFNWEFDFEKIKKSAGFIKILSDRNDYAVRIEQGKFLHENLGGELIETESQEPHFTANQEPVILNSLVPSIKVFTTRPDTLFGATYMVLAPEHALVRELKNQIENWSEVEKYIKKAAAKTQLERTDLAKEKTGVELKGVKAINPGNGEEVPIWIADYVLSSYGTGAIMAVPAHDERDFEFAKKYNLPIREVVIKKYGEVLPNAMPRDVAHAITIKGDKVLLVFNKKINEYQLPGGRIEAKENPEATLLREFTEETGYDHIHIEEYLGQIEQNYNFAPENVNNHRLCKVYKVKILDDHNIGLAESDKDKLEVVWVDAAEAIQHFARGSWKGTEEFITRSGGKYGLCYFGNGVMINSGEFNGLSNEEAKWKITKKVGGQKAIQYKLRDWLISRQRYWGAPIPIIYCDKCARLRQGFGGQSEHPVPEEDLPVVLPTDVDFRPKGESPLARSKSFHKVKCPKCGSAARRESDTMDTFVDSSWYFLRYTDPKNKKEFAGKDKIKTWLPVDTYVGGAEHAVLHLMYARFIYMALCDLGFIETKIKRVALQKALSKNSTPNDEPFLSLRNQGLILGPDGQKMSKSRGNVINPDEVIEQFGADTMRLYEMFMGPLEDAKPWDTNGIVGVRRFLERVWEMGKFQVSSFQPKAGQPLADKFQDKKREVNRELHKLIKKVGDDIVSFNFNTAVSQFMIFVNAVYKIGEISQEHLELFLKVLNPFAPHIANELWSKLGHKGLLEKETWPKYNASLLVEDEVTYAVQVNGKVRSSVTVAADADEDEVARVATKNAKVAKYLTGKKITKQIFVPGRLINFVVK
ncbi:MAG: hypothetical protein A3H70_00260 [Candidatus Komeilibacteria bacterium RIFCSPLOWO2_02_FULL_48_11]|uniref:Leucine--tRNA ligase n=1 Tax=Candidatus Komeilibacteria bacterium RIFCSPLOWO2_02_FULL_48_11 TaxID=1798553 RepID=A0A1G2BW65_9BACT|nr:MAG: hypothetical protein A3H70_00260 [Candidatus Komeilibacteria bacterium RIFCSPLOWO2_02_FULL_48_11]